MREIVYTRQTTPDPYFGQIQARSVLIDQLS